MKNRQLHENQAWMAGVIVDLLLQQDLQEWHSLFVCPSQTVQNRNASVGAPSFVLDSAYHQNLANIFCLENMGVWGQQTRGKGTETHQNLCPEDRQGKGRQGVSSFDNRDNTCKNTWSHKCHYHLRNLIQAFPKILKLAKGKGFLTVCDCKVLHWVCTYTYIWLFKWHHISGPWYHLTKMGR